MVDPYKLSTHYYFFGNEEGDGYEIYFDEYPDVKGFGEIFDEAYEDAIENYYRYIELKGSVNARRPTNDKSSTSV